MHFTCDKAEFINCITIAARTVSQKSTISSLEGIYVTAGHLLTLTGYNLETGISVSMEADVKEMGAAIFPAKLLGDIVRKMPEDTVTIRVDDNYKCKISSGLSSFTIMVGPSDDYPNLPDVEFDKAVWVPQNILKDMLTAHDRVVFNGNGYSQEWVEEAARRGLPHIKTTPEALEVLSREDSIALMEKYGVLSRAELLARKEIQMENFEKLIDIEAKTCLNMLNTIYMPAIAAQMTDICGTVASIQAAGIQAGLKAAAQRAEAIGSLYDELPGKVEALTQAIAEGNPTGMRAAMESAREVVDALEAIVDADLWPVPTYAQMLNIHSK